MRHAVVSFSIFPRISTFEGKHRASHSHFKAGMTYLRVKNRKKPESLVITILCLGRDNRRHISAVWRARECIPGGASRFHEEKRERHARYIEGFVGWPDERLSGVLINGKAPSGRARLDKSTSRPVRPRTRTRATSLIPLRFHRRGIARAAGET